VYRFVIVTRK